MSKYVFDDYGQKYEGMSKDEILETIGMGEARTNVFTGNVTYNNETIPYDYNGTVPSDALLVKLLNQGLDFETVYLTEQEIASIIAMAEFKIHFFLCETEVYVTNGHCDRIAIYNLKLGYTEIYTRSQDKNYYMRSNSEINKVQWVTQAWYDDNPHDADVIYVIENANYQVPHAISSDTATNADNASKLGDVLPEGYVNTIENQIIDGHKTFNYSVWLGANDSRIMPYADNVNDIGGVYNYISRSFKKIYVNECTATKYGKVEIYNDTTGTGTTDEFDVSSYGEGTFYVEVKNAVDNLLPRMTFALPILNVNLEEVHSANVFADGVNNNKYAYEVQKVNNSLRAVYTTVIDGDTGLYVGNRPPTSAKITKIYFVGWC